MGSTSFSNWVAYTPNKETIATTVDLQRLWKKDPLLPTETTLEPKRQGKSDDYYGAYKAKGYERGHLTHLSAFADTPFRRTTHYYSNIAPMKTALNQGPWKKLEEAERMMVRQPTRFYVLTGPLYETPMSCNPKGRDPWCLPNADEDHIVPSHYWKVIVSDRGSKATAFIMPQDVSRQSSYCDYIVSLNEVERRSRLALLPALERLPERDFNKRLGCQGAPKKGSLRGSEDSGESLGIYRRQSND